MDHTAISKIGETAVLATGEASVRLPKNAVALPDDFNIHDLEPYLPGRTRFRGTFSTSSIHDFVAHVQATPGGQGFIDTNDMEATVFFNLGAVSEPGHGDHLAILAPRMTPAYESLRGINGRPLTQQQAIDWLEDWGHLVAAWKEADGGVQEIKLAKAVSALRKVKIESKSSTETQQQNFAAAQSRLDSIEASAEDGLPDVFTITTAPHLGLNTRTIRMRLSVLTGGPAPKLGFRVLGYEQLIEDIGQEFKEKLIAELGDAATVRVGEFRP